MRNSKRAKKNFHNSEFKNKRMNDETFAQRRVVMGFVREAKQLLGDKFRRIDVRIGERTHRKNDFTILGMARLNADIIWIPENTLQLSKSTIRHVVLHEIVHAIAGKGHDETCPLMSATIRENKPEVITQAFLSHFS